MFGNNDDNQQQSQGQDTGVDTQTDTSAPGMVGFTPPPVDPAPGPSDTPEEVGELSVPTIDPTPTPSPVGTMGDLSVPEPSSDDSAAPAPATGAPEAEDELSSSLTPSTNDLVRIKQEALEKLSPLVDHLDQTPDEKFRTTMMMIQATDDPSKIKDAYEAAQNIEDEKSRAQALLDVVNEINYFSQQQNKDA